MAKNINEVRIKVIFTWSQYAIGLTRAWRLRLKTTNFCLDMSEKKPDKNVDTDET